MCLSILTLITYSQEDIIVKLMEFFMEPHATTSDLLAEKEQVCHFINFPKYTVTMLVSSSTWPKYWNPFHAFYN